MGSGFYEDFFDFVRRHRQHRELWDMRIYIMNNYVTPSIAIPGVVGNIMTIVVLSKHVQTSTNMFLIALAVSDLIHVVFGTCPEIFDFKRMERDYPDILYFLGFLYFASVCTSNWLTVAFGAERYIQVRWPLKGRIIYLLPAAAVLLIPLGLLIIFNFLLIHALRVSRRRRADLTEVNSQRKTDSKSENKITIMLISVVMLAIVCQIPCAFAYIGSANQGKDIDIFLYFAVLFTHFNAAANFILYNALNEKYRQTATSIFCPKCISNTPTGDTARKFSFALPLRRWRQRTTVEPAAQCTSAV